MGERPRALPTVALLGRSLSLVETAERPQGRPLAALVLLSISPQGMVGTEEPLLGLRGQSLSWQGLLALVAMWPADWFP